MKLTIEKLTQLSEQDRIDLGKIWQDVRYQSALRNEISNENVLFVARFNERLLAACWVKLSDEKAVITDFMVRDVTRRRGVGHYLLTQCLSAYPDIDHWQAISLSVEESGYDIAHAFLVHHQFSASTQSELYILNNSKDTLNNFRCSS
ncbi:aspartate 1-decarboxylase autocleavage activator PanM [Proteus sp. ZN5]|uniref:aspartate 1-decarboxylase autocleavage activator PanM n=1 Tax=Proteus sp. ZN5 TaxID=2697019 RepID=UPI0013E11B1A|nr:aspartate 1-decarboxylase autocleavage activator PanM [Proteus sp. ZN5]QIG07353.1 aspartate 1-decarboxylase autocleavage activator PanM [Proteus sp. ZN5]